MLSKERHQTATGPPAQLARVVALSKFLLLEKRRSFQPEANIQTRLSETGHSHIVQHYRFGKRPLNPT